MLVAAILLARSAGRPADVVLAIAAAGLAATVVSGLHDPAAAMLAAVPVSVMQRRVLRLGLLGLPALAVWFLLDSLTAARLSGPGPLLAAGGVRCGRRAVGTAATGRGRRGIAPRWPCSRSTGSCRAGTVSDVAGWWLTEPWWVLAAAALLCVAGRRR